MRGVWESLRFVGLVAVIAMAASTAAAADQAALTWSLRDVNGKKVMLQDLPKKWLLVYFGYTSCPDLCPTALVDMSAILDDLDVFADQIQPVFITIDPARDTPDALKRYIANFAAPILALTGSETEIRQAARQVDYRYVRYKDPTLAAYGFDHSSSFFLIDPERRRASDFAADEPAAETAMAIRSLLSSRRAETHPQTGISR